MKNYYTSDICQLLISGVGVKTASDILCESLQVILDYTTPHQKELSRDLENKIKPYIRWVITTGAYGLVGTGFTSRYWVPTQSRFLKAQWVVVRPLHLLLSH